jgi:hypothetical protein
MMASLPASNTDRAFLDYQTCGAIHTLMVRVLPGATDAEVEADLISVTNAVSPLCYASTVTGFRRAAIHSNVTVPATLVSLTDWGSGAGSTEEVPNFWSFTGRDTLGHKARWDFYGRKVPPTANFRVLASANVNVAATVEAIFETESSFVSIAARTCLMNEYANQTTSAYWQRQLRKT